MAKIIASPHRDTPAATARRVMRGADRATLATSYGGWPFASLVLVALDHDASPLLLMSDLAEHAKNIKANERVSLLFDGTAGLDDPLTGPRVTVLGEARTVEDAPHEARFLRRHPAAELYAGFSDFQLYRVSVTRAHLVAGFGRIHWIEGRELLLPAAGFRPGEDGERLAVLNADGTLMMSLTRRLGLVGEGWHLTGIDLEGADLRCGGLVARLDFEAPVTTLDSACAALNRIKPPAT